jgi:hypothetical protein
MRKESPTFSTIRTPSAAEIAKALADATPKELHIFERLLKKIGKRRMAKTVVGKHTLGAFC